MTELKESLDQLTLPENLSSKWQRFTLKWVEHSAGFEVFNLTTPGGHRLSIGDDADYLHFFMAIANGVYQSGNAFQPLLIASDTGGNRLLVKYYTEEEKQTYKYAYIALGNAVKQLPESTINDQISFFAEINLEQASVDGFEKEAVKAARTMSGDVKEAWLSIIDQRLDFLKTDLYVFQILKLYSWGFQIVDSLAEYQFVRAKRPQPRGASRH